MPLETAQYINGLEPSYPAATDQVQQADDHLRLIKAVIKNTFPNITGPITLDQDTINDPPSSVPVGLISMWWGQADAVPAGYGLCDGTVYNRTDGSGTIASPDLRNRIPMGAGSTVGHGLLAGALTSSKTTSTSGAHSHTTNSAGDHTHGVGTLDIQPTTAGSTTRTGDYSVVGTTTGPYVTSVDSHDHTITGETALAGAHSHTTDSQGDHSHTVTVDTLPPVMGLHFIMKI